MEQTTSPPRIGTAGRWQVTTTSSTYLLDLDARTVVRASGAVPVPTAPVPRQRSGVEPTGFLAVISGELGSPLVLALEVRGDDRLVLQRSSPVREIRSLGT